MSRKVRVGFTREFLDKKGKFFIPDPGLRLLDEIPNLEYDYFPEYLPEVTPEQIRGFDMAVTAYCRWTARTLIDNNQLISVHRCGVGYEMIDIKAFNEAGVMLCIAPEGVRHPMAVAIMTFLLALSSRLLFKDKLTREGRASQSTSHLGYGLVGKTLGSIGVGNIGQEVFLLAKPFGMKHIAYDPYVTQEAVANLGVKLVDLDTVLSESDYLNISCLLNDSTYHMMGERELAKMKRTAFLINTARGPIVDEAALVKALQEGWIQGAGLDVFEQEPVSADNPLLKMDNVIVTPHGLGFTDQLFTGIWAQDVRQISQILRGEVPEALVNPEALDNPKLQSKLKALQVVSK